MSAYKQRTSYHHHRQRDDHSSDLRDEDFAQDHTPTAHSSVALGQPPTTTSAFTSSTVASVSAATMASSSSPSVTQQDIHPSFATAGATALPHHFHLHGSTTSSGLFQSISHAGSSYHTAAEDEQQQQQDILMESNLADLEWTPIRNSASVARAKQRQQQYRERQQERTREWQSLLNQHYRPTVPATTTSTSSQQHHQQQQHGSLSSSSSSWVTTALAGSPRQGSAGVGNLYRPVSHDTSTSINIHDSAQGSKEQRTSGKSQSEESPSLPLVGSDAHHEIIPGSGPRTSSTLFFHPGSSTPAMEPATTAPSAATAAPEEQLSGGYSDFMTSDGLESLGGGSEDLGVWSQADYEADDDDDDDNEGEEVLSFTLSTPPPMLQRHRFSFSNTTSSSSALLTAQPQINPGSTTTRRPPVSERSRSSSSATSLSQLPRPSFAIVSPSSNTRPHPSRPLETYTRASSSLSEGVHNQMPHHDGSGNFIDLMDGQPQQQQPQQLPQQGYRSSSSQTIDLLSDLEDSSLDLDLGWESSSSQESSLLRAYQRPLTASYAHRRRISSSEFKTVIQNIADLQHQSALLLPHQSLDPAAGSGNSHSSHHSGGNVGHQGVLSSPLSLSRLQRRSAQTNSHPGGVVVPQESSSRPRFTYLYSGSKRPIFNIYEDEMEDMADMMYEMPAKLGWMEAFQATLMALEPCESTPYSLEADKWHPIKVLTALSTVADRPEGHKEQNEKPIAALDQDNSDRVAEDGSSSNKKETLLQIRENMNAATMEAMQRLQQNGRRRAAGRPVTTQNRTRHHYRGASFDPMQVDFSPTVRALEQDSSSLGQHGDGRLTSHSTGTSTSHSMLDSSLWAVVLSTLRRFRDHVQSNFLFEAYEDEDLGAQWSSTSSSRARLTRENLAQLRSGRTTRSTSSSVSSYSNRGGSGVRRVNSDCGMESLRDQLYSHSTYPHHQLEPRLVE